MKELTDRQQRFVNTIDRIRDNLGKLGRIRRKRETFESNWDVLRMTWEEFENNHRILMDPDWEKLVKKRVP